MLGLGLGITKTAGLRSLAQKLLSILRGRATYYENGAASKEEIQTISDYELLDKATILLTPTAYSDARVHCVKTYTGDELVTNGGFDTDSDWTLGTGWSIANGKASYDNSGTASLTQSFTWESGKTYEIQFEVSDFTSNYRFDLYSGSSFIQSAIVTDKTTWKIYFVGDGGTTMRFRGLTTESFSIDNVSVVDVSSDFDFDRASSATRVNSNGIIEDIAANQPRINYTPSASGTVANSGHILLEPTSTNWSANESTNPDTWHSSNNVSITTGKADPMGGTDAAEVTVTSVSGTTYTRNLFSGNSGMHTQFTVSYFLKYVDHQWIMIRPIFWNGGEENKTWFDIENGVIGTNNNDNATIEAYPNGWYRCSVTFTIDPSTDASGYVYIQAMDGDGSNTQTNSVKYQACFSQGEDKDFPTSYIPVASDASPVTRTQGTLTGSGNSTLINSTEGVLYAEIAALANSGTSRRITISDGDLSDRVTLTFDTNNNALSGFILSNSSTEYSFFEGVASALDFNKIAVKWKTNDFSIWINGVEYDVDTSGNAPSGLNTLRFDNGNNSSPLQPFHGKVKALAVFNEVLEDDELELLTGVTNYGSFGALASANGYTII